MARTALTKTTVLGAYGDYSGANVADITFAAGDLANGNEWTLKDGDVLLAWNQGGSAYTVTIDSTPTPAYNREGDITAYSVGVDEIAAFGPFKAPGWRQTDGTVHVDVSNVSIYLAVLEQ